VVTRWLWKKVARLRKKNRAVEGVVA